MNKTFIKIGAVLALLAMLVFVIPFGLPSRYLVVRTVTINAQPAAIHPSVNTLKEWPEVERLDHREVPRPEDHLFRAGSGRRCDRRVRSRVGRRPRQVRDHQERSRRRASITNSISTTGTYVSTGGIKYAKEGDGTKVTWTNEGELGWNPISRWCNAFGMMDSMMGPDFESGLANLKKKVEAEVAAAEKAPGAGEGTRGATPC